MNVLFLTHRLPYAPDRGDRIRAYHLLAELTCFADVSLFSLVHDTGEESRAREIESASAIACARVSRPRGLVRGAASLLGRRPLTHVLLDSPAAPGAIAELVESKRPDVVLAYCSSMARFCLEPPLRDIPFVLDMVDVDSAKWQELSRTGRRGLRWIYRREADTLGAFEVEASRRARRTLVVTERERAELVDRAPDLRVDVVGNGIDVGHFRPATTAAPAPIVVFCGVMSYYPNDEGVRWFADRIWPRVLAASPDARLQIVGAGPSRWIRRLGEQQPSIEVTGYVPDTRPYLWNAAVSIAPMRTARGLQNKVLEALAAGLPVVSTRAVREGLPSQVLGGCRLAESETDFAREVIALLEQPPSVRRQVAASADLSSLAWHRTLAPLEQILVDATHPDRLGSG